MRSKLNIVTGMFAAVIFVTTSAANAQDIGVGSFFQGLFRGAEFSGNPLFLSNPQNGPLFNFNQFRQRVEFNQAGDGYTYEFFRFFGPDSFNNNTFLDLGPLDIALFPDPALGQGQEVGIHGRVGYTTRFIPEIFIETETGQRAFTNQFQTGANVFNIEPIGYAVDLSTGIQDFSYTGNILIDQSTKINIFGFYDTEFRLVNNGEMTTDGVFVSDEVVTDFDTGPIDVSGHIVLDLIAGIFNTNGNASTAAPFAIGSGAAQRAQTPDDMLARLEAGETLTDEELQALVQDMFVSAIAADPLGFIFNGLPSTIPGFEGLNLELTGTTASDEIVIDSDTETVPEPGMVMMFGVLGVVGCLMNPRKRRRYTAVP